MMRKGNRCEGSFGDILVMLGLNPWPLSKDQLKLKKGGENISSSFSFFIFVKIACVFLSYLHFIRLNIFLYQLFVLISLKFFLDF